MLFIQTDVGLLPGVFLSLPPSLTTNQGFEEDDDEDLDFVEDNADARAHIIDAYPYCRVVPFSRLNVNETGVKNGDISSLHAGFLVSRNDASLGLGRWGLCTPKHEGLWTLWWPFFCIGSGLLCVYTDQEGLLFCRGGVRYKASAKYVEIHLEPYFLDADAVGRKAWKFSSEFQFLAVLL